MPITKFKTRYLVIGREQQRVTRMRKEHAEPVLALEVWYAGRFHRIGEFKLAEFRLLLGSDHEHYAFIVERMLPSRNSFEESDLNDLDYQTEANKSYTEKIWEEADGLEVTLFGKWAQKYPDAAMWAGFLPTS